MSPKAQKRRSLPLAAERNDVSGQKPNAGAANATRSLGRAFTLKRNRRDRERSVDLAVGMTIPMQLGFPIGVGWHTEEEGRSALAGANDLGAGAGVRFSAGSSASAGTTAPEHSTPTPPPPHSAASLNALPSPQAANEQLAPAKVALGRARANTSPIKSTFTPISAAPSAAGEGWRSGKRRHTYTWIQHSRLDPLFFLASPGERLQTVAVAYGIAAFTSHFAALFWRERRGSLDVVTWQSAQRCFCGPPVRPGLFCFVSVEAGLRRWGLCAAPVQ